MFSALLTRLGKLFHIFEPAKPVVLVCGEDMPHCPHCNRRLAWTENPMVSHCYRCEEDFAVQLVPARQETLGQQHG